MNDSIKKENFFTKLQGYISSYFRTISIIIILLIIIFGVFQFYIFNINNKILKSSILYNVAKNNSEPLEFKKNIEKLSDLDNFYGTMAKLEKISLVLDSKEINQAYDEYLYILNEVKLNNLYKSAIAVKASYSLLNTIDDESKLDKEYCKNVITKIINLISYIDENITSYEGYKLEILYLTSIINNEQKLNIDIQKSNILFNKIIENDEISSSLKERVKKIDGFQKYK